mmetsp:Transcript_11031/g.12787  ORF Transcript_11031/g.12787 Transcript_11031/m.12787 type:complete len:106 (+) Transcript_11031:172-489(+)
MTQTPICISVGQMERTVSNKIYTSSSSSQVPRLNTQLLQKRECLAICVAGYVYQEAAETHLFRTQSSNGGTFSEGACNCSKSMINSVFSVTPQSFRDASPEFCAS